MYLRAGVISMSLLLASRVLGLLRETAQAAAFGATAQGDMAVVMLTLPDLASSILAAGALSYALLPWWAGRSSSDVNHSQRRAAHWLLGLGGAFALLLWVFAATAGGWLAPGLGADSRGELAGAIRWAAPAVPVALLGALWGTRLQHERDVVGMYGMNVAFTAVLVCVLVALWKLNAGAMALTWLGAGLLVAAAARLAFVRWRMGRLAPAQPVVASAGRPQPLPAWTVWFWAAMAPGLPLALMLLARSLVSHSGEGSLAVFNYAWKLVDLPNQLAVQLVAVLAFPAIAAAQARGDDAGEALRTALVLAWTLACASALGLWLGARPLAVLLFGWGRMDAARLVQVGDWAAWGGWSLLPLSVIAVVLLMLATTGRLRVAGLAYAGGIAALALLGMSGLHEGRDVMQVMVGLFCALAAVMFWLVREHAPPWRQMALPLAAALLAAPARPLLEAVPALAALAVAALATLLVLGLCWAFSPLVRTALKR